MSDAFDPALATKIAMEMTEDDERALSGPWFSGADPSHFDAPEITDRKTFAWYIGTDATAAAIARLRNNARSAASQLRAAVAEVERLGNAKKYDVSARVSLHTRLDEVRVDRDRLAARVKELEALAGEALKVADGLVDLAAPGLDTFRDLAITDIADLRERLAKGGK